MDLMIIGRFEEVTQVAGVVERLAQLKELAEQEWPEDNSWQGEDERLTPALTQALWDMKVYDMGRSDVDIFVFEHTVDHEGTEVRIWTEEKEIQGFIKVLMQFGAKIEIYSKHDWADDGTARPKGDS